MKAAKEGKPQMLQEEVMRITDGMLDCFYAREPNDLPTDANHSKVKMKGE